MTLYEQGIEAAARYEYEGQDRDSGWWDRLSEHGKQIRIAEMGKKIEAFLSVQPTLRWCEVHNGFGWDALQPFGRDQCLKARPGLEDDPPCRIVEQRRVST